MSQRLTFVNILRDPQVLLGVPILVLLLTRAWASGTLRRAFRLPPPVANSLTGSHLLLILAAFFGVMSVAGLTLQSLGLSSHAPATAPAPPPVPDQTSSAADTGPAAQTQVSPPAGSEPAPTTVPATQAAPEPPLRQKAFSLAAQALGEIALLIGMLYLARDHFAGGLKGFGLRADRLGRDFVGAIVGYLAFWPACVLIATVATVLLQMLAPQWKPPEHSVLLLLEEPGQSLLWSILPLVLAGGIAPLFEEVFFRGLLLSWLRKTTGSAWVAILFTGAAFGIIHAPQWHLVPALASLGLLLGFLYVRTGSLTLAILLHMIFNIRTLVLVAIFGESAT
jgi:membrane protease YdiL (CAAX protease family)